MPMSSVTNADHCQPTQTVRSLVRAKIVHASESMVSGGAKELIPDVNAGAIICPKDGQQPN